MIKKMRESITKRIKLNENIDPIFEIQRILRISGIKIKEINYDIKGNAEIELAKKTDIEEAIDILKEVKTLSHISISNDKDKIKVLI